MPISVADWRKVRHASAEGSGVAGAIGNWIKFCTDPEKLDDPGRQKAIVTAETLRRALETAEGKLHPDSKLKNKCDTLKKTKPTEPKKKAELAALEKEVQEDEAQVKDTRVLIKTWDGLATKYIRSVMKTNAVKRQELENHKAKVKEILDNYTYACKFADIGKGYLQDAISDIEDLAVQGEKQLALTLAAKRSSNGPALEAGMEKVEELRATGKKIKTAAAKSVQQLIDQGNERYATPDPWIKHSLTNAKLGAQLRKGADKAFQELQILEYSVEKLDDILLELEDVLKKITKATTEGLDETAELEASLQRGILRLTEQLRRVKTVVELGVGGNIEQAGLEIINLQQDEPKTTEERTKVWDTAHGLLAQAAKNMPTGDAVLKRTQAMFEEIESMVPPGFEKTSANAKKLTDSLREKYGSLEKYFEAQRANRAKHAKLSARLKELPKEVASV